MARTRSLVAIFAAATLALTGCSGDGGNGGGGGKLDYEDSPLSKYLMAVFSNGLSPDATPQEQQDFYNERQRKTEELVAECMSKEGFEYVPNVNNGGVVIDSEGDNKWRPDDRDWVEKYGYGAINSPWQEEAPEPEPTEYVDPNQQYIESLPEAEQQAYNEALWGKPMEGGTEDEPQEYNWENSGCWGWAQHEVEGDNPWEQEDNKPIIEAIQTFYESLQSNPDFAKLDAAWSTCMAEAGHDGFKTQPDAQNSIYELTNKYWENAPQGEGEMDPNFGTPKDPEYAKIAETEIPLAMADLECREKTDYRQQQLRIQFDMEEQFIADHQADLDALKARVEQGQK
ncbi:MAG: hypothetical protein LCH76_00525 [Actinobacteria bacterium]|nr:hypothetical protein [Actinomycetota bacterium]